MVLWGIKVSQKNIPTKTSAKPKEQLRFSSVIYFDGIAILLLPFGLLHKFVIVFVTPYFFARETPVSEKKLCLHSLTHTSLWLGYVPARLLYFIKGIVFPGHKATHNHSTWTYKLYILSSPCPASYGSVVTVTFHPPVSNNYASRRPLAAYWGCLHKSLAYTSGIPNGSPALCVHIPYSHCPEHAIQWH